MAGYIIDENELDLESGWLCLDYANTAEWHASDQPIEQLNTYADLVEWARSIGLIGEPDAERWLAEGRRRPDEAAETLLWAIDLREALYRVFTALSAEDQPAPADLSIVNQALADALPHLRLTARPGGIPGSKQLHNSARVGEHTCSTDISIELQGCQKACHTVGIMVVVHRGQGDSRVPACKNGGLDSYGDAVGNLELSGIGNSLFFLAIKFRQALAVLLFDVFLRLYKTFNQVLFDGITYRHY